MTHEERTAAVRYGLDHLDVSPEDRHGVYPIRDHRLLPLSPRRPTDLPSPPGEKDPTGFSTGVV